MKKQKEEKQKAKIIAVLNQKGGVGKTTTVANLAYSLAKKGKDVLAIDFDSQTSLTNYLNVGLGSAPEEYISVYELLLKRIRKTGVELLDEGSDAELFEMAIVKPSWTKSVYKANPKGESEWEETEEPFGFDLLPCKLELSDYELELGRSAYYNGFQLTNLIEDIIAWHPYDYVIIDCNPSLGILTMNAIFAAKDGILIPTNLDVMSTRGIPNLIDRICQVQEELKTVDIDHMGVIGIILNLYADRRVVDKTLKNEMNRFYPFKIFSSTIPESVNAKKAALTGLIYSQLYKKAENAYDKLADEIENQLKEMEKVGPMILKIEDQLDVTNVDIDSNQEDE